MFHNIGEKIKTLAKVCTVIGIILSIISGIILMIDLNVWIGLLCIVGGCILSWIGSFLVYGFGEVIVKLNEISSNLQDQKKLSVAKTLKRGNTKDNKADEIIQEVVNTTLEEYEEKDEGDINKPKANECPNCFSIITPNDIECPNCGYKLKH